MKLRLERQGMRGKQRATHVAAEAQSHLTEERYRALAETLRAVPWEGEPATNHVTYVGPQIEALTGYTVEEWMAPGAWPAALHPEDRDAAVRKYEWHLERRLDHNLEYRLITRSGREIWLRDIITFVTTGDGREIVRGLVIVIEEEKALERALRESEARYRHAERIAKLVHWSVALGQGGGWNSHTVTFSNTASEILGLPAGKLQLSNAEALERLIHPDDRDHVRKALMDAVAKRQSEVNLTYRIVRPDGAVRWVVEHAHNDFDEAGRRVGAFGIIQDITEHKQRETELAAASLRAEVANRAKTQFLATMSHELRTPLNAIIGFSEMMKLEIAGPLGAGAYKDYAADIHGSGTFLLAIINELLDLSRIDSGEMKLDESPLQIEKVISGSLSLLLSKAQAKGIQLTQSVPPDPPLIRADARRIKQALLNLVTNALKFTPSGGTVHVAAAFSESGLVLSVTDTGIGIAGKDLDSVTKPFVQLENWLARQHEGAGLGLPIAKGICELHGGTLALESQLGKGTVARIVLPADRIVAPAAASTAAS
jgi:PAS domain S-box-containing protein